MKAQRPMRIYLNGEMWDGVQHLRIALSLRGGMYLSVCWPVRCNGAKQGRLRIRRMLRHLLTICQSFERDRQEREQFATKLGTVVV